MNAIPTDLPLCATPECRGVVIEGDTCLAHVSVERLPRLLEADRIDGRGGRYDADRLAMLVEALPEERGRRRLAGELLLDESSFAGPLEWQQLETQRPVSFRRVHFEDRADLFSCIFNASVDFSGARFGGDTEMVECGFMAGATFSDAVFEGTVRLPSYYEGLFSENCVFKRFTTFLNLRGKGQVMWSSARFDAPVWFGCFMEEGGLRLSDSTFADTVQFGRTRVTSVDLTRTRFQRGGDLGIVLADGLVDCQDATFENPIRLRVRAKQLDLRRSLFLSGGELLVEGALVGLAGASFQRPTTLAATKLGAELQVPEVETPIPQVGQLAGADVGELTLDGFDLGRCRFVGAHNLDRLRLGDSVALPRSPRRVLRPRATIYDEGQVRRAAGDERWAKVPPPAELASLEVQPDPAVRPLAPPPAAVAGVYRALRKGREDAKDAPDASDLYYGEMEMRRRAEGGLLLPAYWLVSGYGTRPIRALAAYAVVVAMFTAIMHCYGFHSHHDWVHSLTWVLTATVFVDSPGTGLTAGGEVAQLALRILGPLFLGLALLALRSRVQR